MSVATSKIVLKSPREIELMRAAGGLVASVHREIAQLAKPGSTTAEMNELAGQLIRDAGATPLFLGVRNPQARFPFPACVCASVNDEVVHGIPDDRPLREGDVVSIDIGVRLNGYCGDAARTLAIGSVSSRVQRLLDVTREALDVAIEEMRPQRRWSEVATLMQRCVERRGFGVVREFVGHGIGVEMHEEPKVPNYFDRALRKSDFELLPGMTLAVEPMVTVGRPDVEFKNADRWTVVTKDRSWAAHFEHSLAVTENGVEILTGD